MYHGDVDHSDTQSICSLSSFCQSCHDFVHIGLQPWKNNFPWVSVLEKGNGSSIFSIQALSLQITLYLYKLELSLNLAFSIHNNETLYCLREEPDANIFISTVVLCTAILSVNLNSLTIHPLPNCTLLIFFWSFSLSIWLIPWNNNLDVSLSWNFLQQTT